MENNSCSSTQDMSCLFQYQANIIAMTPSRSSMPSTSWYRPSPPRSRINVPRPHLFSIFRISSTTVCRLSSVRCPTQQMPSVPKPSAPYASPVVLSMMVTDALPSTPLSSSMSSPAVLHMMFSHVSHFGFVYVSKSISLPSLTSSSDIRLRSQIVTSSSSHAIHIHQLGHLLCRSPTLHPTPPSPSSQLS